MVWLALSCLAGQTGPAHTPPEKQVVPSVEILPNYLMHLFLASGVWDRADQSYARLRLTSHLRREGAAIGAGRFRRYGNKKISANRG